MTTADGKASYFTVKGLEIEAEVLDVELLSFLQENSSVIKSGSMIFFILLYLHFEKWSNNL